MKICPYCEYDSHENCLRHKGRTCECPTCMNPELEKPVPLYMYGLDPASKNDYFGCVIHALPAYQEGVRWLPHIVDLFNIRNLPFDTMLEKLTKDYFAKYPPYFVGIDYTNEKTFTDLLVKDYGEERIDPIRFTNDSKLGLKQDGLSILKQGYKFPNWTRVKDPQRAKWGNMLETQLQQEQILTTKDHSAQRFDHPVGDNNDLSTAWELSIHECLRLILHKGANPNIIGVNETREEDWNDMDLFPELERFGDSLHTDVQSF